MTGIKRFVLSTSLLAILVGCSQNPKMTELQNAVDLMTRIIRSRVLLDAVRNADPQVRASTAVSASMHGGITANFPQPPEDITILLDEKTPQQWCVIVTGDDSAKQVRIEGYGEDLKKPVIVKKIDFPPK